MLDKLLDQFLEHGLIGALTVASSWVSWKLYRENGVLRAQMLEREIARVAAYHDLARDLEETIQASLEALERGGGRIRTKRRFIGEET